MANLSGEPLAAGCDSGRAQRAQSLGLFALLRRRLLPQLRLDVVDPFLLELVLRADIASLCTADAAVTYSSADHTWRMLTDGPTSDRQTKHRARVVGVAIRGTELS